MNQYDHRQRTWILTQKTKKLSLNLRWSLTPQQSILLGSTYLKSNFESKSIINEKQDIDSVGYYLQHQHKSDKN